MALTDIFWGIGYALGDRTASGQMMNDNRKRRVCDIQNAANEALDAARNLAPGTARIEALKKAGALRKAADKTGLIFAKRGRPAK